MTSSDDPEDTRETTHTSIEVDEQVWRHLRSRAVREDKRVSEMLEVILREQFEMPQDESGDN